MPNIHRGIFLEDVKGPISQKPHFDIYFFDGFHALLNDYSSRETKEETM
jgi:hypothetical protein